MTDPTHFQYAEPTLLEGAGVIALAVAVTLCTLGRAAVGRLRSLR